MLCLFFTKKSVYNILIVINSIYVTTKKRLNQKLKKTKSHHHKHLFYENFNCVKIPFLVYLYHVSFST
jgi:hypothetical protein